MQYIFKVTGFGLQTKSELAGENQSLSLP